MAGQWSMVSDRKKEMIYSKPIFDCMHSFEDQQEVVITYLAL